MSVGSISHQGGGCDGDIAAQGSDCAGGIQSLSCATRAIFTPGLISYHVYVPSYGYRSGHFIAAGGSGDTPQDPAPQLFSYSRGYLYHYRPASQSNPGGSVGGSVRNDVGSSGGIGIYPR